MSISRAARRSRSVDRSSVEETHRPESARGLEVGRAPFAYVVLSGRANSSSRANNSASTPTGEDARLDAVAIVNASLSRRWRAEMSWGGGRFSSRRASRSTTLVTKRGLIPPGFRAGRRVRFEVRVR